MSQDSIKRDMEEHPELTPILDEDRNGSIVCLGWKSPVYDWDKISDLTDLLKKGESK
jgi:hypothetical protein